MQIRTMITIPLYRFRAALSDIVKRAHRGDGVILTHHGKPIAQLLPLTAASWYGVTAIPPETRQRPRIRPFQGPGTLSREVLRERRRNG